MLPMRRRWLPDSKKSVHNSEHPFHYQFPLPFVLHVEPRGGPNDSVPVVLGAGNGR